MRRWTSTAPRPIANSTSPVAWVGTNDGGRALTNLIRGCMADTKGPEQPTMYLSMANGGATLDPQAAASMRFCPP